MLCGRKVQILALQKWGLTACLSSNSVFYTNNVEINSCGQHMHLERWDFDFGWGVGKEGKQSIRSTAERDLLAMVFRE